MTTMMSSPTSSRVMQLAATAAYIVSASVITQSNLTHSAIKRSNDSTLSAGSYLSQSHFKENIIKKVIYHEETETPELLPFIKQASWVSQAQSLFPDMRDFTSDERKSYHASVKSLFKPTGRNLFDYVK